MPLSNRKQMARRSQALTKHWQDTVSREVKKAKRLTILGIGNEQKADDGAGSLCIRLLQRKISKNLGQTSNLKSSEFRASRQKFHRVRLGSKIPDLGKRLPSSRGEIENHATPNLQVLDGGEAPENVTGVIRKFDPTHLLIIDAAIGGHKPGTVFIINKKKISQDDLSTHRIPLSHLVRYLEENVGCRVILIGIEPREISWKKSLSPPVEASIATLVETILKIWNKKTISSPFPEKRLR